MQLLATLLLPIINDAHAPVSVVVLFFAFLIGHALGDYPLQGKFLAIRKNRHIKMVDYTGETPGTLWVYCLSAHALVHAGIVWLILEGFKLPYAVEIAFAEFLLHWFIDFAKCERWTNFHADQSLHLICKLGYIGCYYVL